MKRADRCIVSHGVTAVCLDRREVKCACVGGSSNVPLGFVSLTENLMMITMAVWMALGALGLLPLWAHGM